MAIRPVFEIGEDKFVNIIECDFKWYSGFAKSQKQKSILDLHSKYLTNNKEKKVLEISTSSTQILGVKLSAFNLMIKNKDNEDICSVESLFQSCKKFENGGPYKDIIHKSSIEAKKDMRLKTSGDLVSFNYKGEDWPIEPKTLFYDWIYINTLNQYDDLKKEVLKYDAFTDIEFNPKKSFSCQARSAALFVWLERRKILNDIISSKDRYISFINSSIKEKNNEQMKFY